MTSSSTTDPAVAARRLRFAVGADEPTVPDLTVYRARETRLLGAPARVCIIGSSHRVAAPDLDFFEVASCKPLEGAEAATIDLLDADRTVTAETPAVTCETTVATHPLSWFDADADYDLRHDFGKRATTALDLRADGYDTYHTYPEHDRTLYTATTLRRRDHATKEAEP